MDGGVGGDLQQERQRLEDDLRRLQRDGGSSAEWAAYFDATYAVERAAAAARADQYAEEIDVGVPWSTGAPLPHIVSNGSRCILICLVDDDDPDWDGPSVARVSPSDEHEAVFGVVDFSGCASIRFGSPNDEALSGHPLSGKGLVPYGCHEVHNSAWLAEEIRMNSVHPEHSDAAWSDYRHYVLAFHDEMFEVLARRVGGRRVRSTMSALMHEAVADLVQR